MGMSTLRRLAPWCFALALIFYLRPYTGIRHDATLYLAQALRIISPDIYDGDLFFAAGSQADFTLFPQLLAYLLRYVEPGAAFLALTFGIRVAFFAASAYVIRALFPQYWRWPAIFALIVMPSLYGAFSMFSYAEPFLTARPLAEALSLLAIGLLLRRRLLWALVCLIIAGLMHPLQGAAAALVVWCWLLIQDRRWLWAVSLVVPIGLLGLFRVGPFGGLFQSIDYEWYQQISALSAQIFVGSWEPRDWCIVLSDFYLIYLLLQRTERSGALSKMAAATILAVAIGLAFSAIFADVLKLVLPAGLQIWRVLWLGHWLAMASIPFLIHDQWIRSNRDLVATLLLVAIVVTGASVPRISLPWAVLGLIPLHMLWPHAVSRISRTGKVLIISGIFLILMAALLWYQIRAWTVFEALGSDLERVRQDVVIFSYPLIAGGVVAAVAWLYRQWGSRLGAVLGLGSILLLIGAMSTWDARSPWSRTLETAKGTDIFGVSIPRHSSVYWYASEPSPLGPWLVLERINYFSIFQLSGQMFNRGTPMEGARRKDQVDPVNSQGEICDTMNAVNKDDDSCWIGTEGIRHLCTPHGSTLPPDYFVLPFRQRQYVRGVWDVRHPTRGETLGRLYLYKCSDWVAVVDSAHQEIEQGVDVRFGQ